MLIRKFAWIHRPPPLRTLYGQRVLVSGANGAIGKATCEALREQGARVVGLDRRGGPELVEVDITDKEAVQAAVARAIEELGGLDIVINAAGIGLPVDAGSLPGDEVALTLEVNFLGPWIVTACALPALLASRGRVINVASGLAFANVPFASAYAASKRALSAWSDALRLEYGSHIDVVLINPGYIHTPIHIPSEEAGVSLQDLVREEPLEAAVQTLVRACLGRPRRATATTRMGGLEIGLARHFPALTDLIIMARLRRLGRMRRYEKASLAQGMLKRWEVK